ncbi:transcription factor IBH1-like [Chenopodium quinoa]|uniref:transcription factor IBH1-like n=1 Tax=Chenopodium quinoa TaxID=63459 RepID=UPI000B776AE1|nr:transcription factor IBH1-like [Chenopodium quinoa]
MNPHQNQRLIPLNLKSLRTRFALRFLKALKKINHQEKIHNKINYKGNGNIVMMTHHKFHKIKVAADASMAAAVGPKRAWSRAVLSRIRLSWWRRGLLRRENSIIVARKQRRGAVRQQGGQTQELRRLVPGGEEMDMQKLLDETAHYIKCLTTQVNVMRSIVNYCSTPVN